MTYNETYHEIHENSIVEGKEGIVHHMLSHDTFTLKQI